MTRRDAQKLQPLVESIEAAGGKAVAFGSDARKEEEVIALFDRVEREVGPVEVLVFNIGARIALAHVVSLIERSWTKAR